MRLRISAVLLCGLSLVVASVGVAAAKSIGLEDLPLCISHDATIAEIKRGEPTASLVIIGGTEAARLVRMLNDEMVWGEMQPFFGDNVIISAPSQAGGMARVDLFHGYCSTVTIWGPYEWLERWIGRGT